MTTLHATSMLHIAFIADPLDGFKTYKDSTFAMMAEAVARGHTVHAFEPRDMALSNGVVNADAAQLTLTGETDDWYRASARSERSLAEFDIVVMRKDPPFDMEYVYATYLLQRAEAAGARIVNRPAAIRDHNEKLAIAEFPQFTTPTLVTSDAQRLRAFHATHHDIILKPLDGMGGTGVFRIRADELNLGAIIETLSANGRHSIMAQRFIPAIAQGDKRILLIDGVPVPHSLARIPQGTEVRGNLAAGGVGVAQPLGPRDREIATGIGPILAARGLLLVGLDVIGDCMTEINVTSPTCFQEIRQQTGFNVAGMFVDALEKQRA